MSLRKRNISIGVLSFVLGLSGLLFVAPISSTSSVKIIVYIVSALALIVGIMSIARSNVNQ